MSHPNIEIVPWSKVDEPKAWKIDPDVPVEIAISKHIVRSQWNPNPLTIGYIYTVEHGHAGAFLGTVETPYHKSNNKGKPLLWSLYPESVKGGRRRKTPIAKVRGMENAAKELVNYWRAHNRHKSAYGTAISFHYTGPKEK